MRCPRPLLFLTLVVPVVAHPGGLDANGGHHDRKNGGYHYHRTPPAKSAPAPAAAPAKPVTSPAAASAPSPATENHAPAKQPEGSSTAAPLLSPLTALKIGMTKDQVTATIGKPNVASENSWFYTAGGWVRFRDNAVFSIEAK